jgi:hypothetical protein
LKFEEISQIFNVPLDKIHKNDSTISILFEKFFQVDLCFLPP